MGVPSRSSQPFSSLSWLRNGSPRPRSAGMLFSFEELIAYTSKDETLMPGEFIGSGTVGNGCGCRRRQPIMTIREDRPWPAS
ncbi:fumarylacetoacetate hydrolase family protein [Bradyrhizobium sp. HKCCYLRH2015]|uniref:fumarylacetoacetate hydrolase family protein n=1 Tax=unclassified Bradyrhizobium TaxID=2631580 RepID=UPI0039673C3F